MKKLTLIIVLIIGASSLFAQSSYFRVSISDRINKTFDEERVEWDDFDWFVYTTGVENQHLVFTGTSIENGLFTQQDVLDYWKVFFLISLYQEYEFKTVRIGSDGEKLTKNDMIKKLGGDVSD